MSSTDSSFAATRWTLVCRARGETPQAKAALGELCEAYYQPVLCFLSRQGHEPDRARELAQEFFARILGGNGFAAAHQNGGRFRSYLLGALRHFLADLRKHESRLKRGGGVVTESIDNAGPDDEGALQVADPSAPSPEESFDRQWAVTVIAQAHARLEREFAADGKAQHFNTLKAWLNSEAEPVSQQQAARSLGLSEGAIKVAIHRLRKRFRDAVRNEISQTLQDPSLVDEELRHLIAALSKPAAS